MKTETDIVEQMLNRLLAKLKSYQNAGFAILSESKMNMIEALYLYWREKEQEQIEKGYITY